MREGVRSLEKAILILSAGAFGLSLTFIKLIAPQFKLETIYWLKWSWVFFSLSFLLILLSFLTSKRACDKAIEIREVEIKSSIIKIMYGGM